MVITDPKMDRAMSIAQEVIGDYILSIGSNGQGGGKYSCWDQFAATPAWLRVEVGGGGLELDIRECSVDGGLLEDMSVTRRGQWFYVYGTLASAGVPKLYVSKKPVMLSPDLITYVLKNDNGTADNTKQILLVMRIGPDGKITRNLESDGPRTLSWWPNCATAIGFTGYDHTLTCQYAPTRDASGTPAPNTVPKELYLNTPGDLRFHFLIAPSNFPIIDLNGHAYNTAERKRSMVYFQAFDENGSPVGQKGSTGMACGPDPHQIHSSLKFGYSAGPYYAAPMGWTPDLDSGIGYFALNAQGQFMM